VTDPEINSKSVHFRKLDFFWSKFDDFWVSNGTKNPLSPTFWSIEGPTFFGFLAKFLAHNTAEKKVLQGVRASAGFWLQNHAFYSDLGF